MHAAAARQSSASRSSSGASASWAAAAKAIPDAEADQACGAADTCRRTGLSRRAVRSAVKMYLAVRRDLDADPAIRAAGINCLNESHFSDTTPCLAWNLLYEERQLIWGCEADTMSMVTKYILHQSLDAPIMMTNLYPFLLGNAALKHERIESFPEVEADPENHVLVAHCGYMGVIPTAVCHRVDTAQEGAGDRGRQRLRHRRTTADRRRHAGQAPSRRWTS